MPKVSEYVDSLIAGECSKLAVTDVGDMSSGGSPSSVQTANQLKFANYINQANLALHKRYHLLKKEFEIDYPAAEEEYTLPSNFLIPIHAYYEADKNPVTIRDDTFNIVNDVDTAVAILLPEPFKAIIKGTDQDIPVRTQIILKYAASPVKATTALSTIHLSQVYTEALLNYAAYKAHLAVSGLMSDENNTYYLRYEASCKQIVSSGMWGNNEVDQNTKLRDNGFV